MKRFTTTLTLFLLLGAIVNVTVAWGIVISTNLDHPTIMGMRKSPTLQQVEWWADHAPDGFIKESKVDHILVSEHFGLSNIVIAVNERDSQLSRRNNISFCYIRRVGWPGICVEGALWQGRKRLFQDDRIVYDAALPLPSWARSPNSPWRWLPFRPIWPGFAINALLYAAILWLPIAPFKLRRNLRVKRGLCLNCGYDLRGAEHKVCPECGNEFTAKANS